MLEQVTITNKGRKHSRRRNRGFGSLQSMWRRGTQDMTMPHIAGGLVGGWAATAIPGMVGFGTGFKGIVAGGVTAVLGTVLLAKYVSPGVGLGFSIVSGTIVANRLVKTFLGIGVPYLSDGIRGALNGLPISAPNFSGEFSTPRGLGWGQDETEIFGVESIGRGMSVLEPTYMGAGSY